MSKSEVWQLLRGRFPANEFALLTEVRDKAGHDARNSADFIALNLWPSRGHELSGIEVKSGRGDWLKEYKNPKKAENIYQYCDRFWLLATHDKVVLSEAEIPKSWGFLLCKDGKIFTKKEAPLLTPKELPRTFIASMLKRATSGMIHPSEISDKIKAAVTEELWGVNNDLNKLKNKFDNLEKVCADFEEASGIRLNSHNIWDIADGKKIGGVVKLIMDGKDHADNYLYELNRIKKIATGIISSIDQTTSIYGNSDNRPQAV